MPLLFIMKSLANKQKLFFISWHIDQHENLVETRFVVIFVRAQQILSAQYRWKLSLHSWWFHCHQGKCQVHNVCWSHKNNNITFNWLLEQSNCNLRGLPIVLQSHVHLEWNLKRQCFSIFYDVNMSTKRKTDSEFSRVSFGEIFP